MLSNRYLGKLRAICTLCQKLPKGERCERCRDIRRQVRQERKANGLCAYCGQRRIAPSMEAYCQRCGDSHMRSQGKIKSQVFAHYGYSCSCCGATQDLTIDHIDPELRKHEGNPPQMTLYRLIIKNGFPPDYQVLCRTCNSSKGNGPSCQLHTRGMVVKRTIQTTTTTTTTVETLWDRDMTLLSAEEFMAKYT